MTEDPEDPIDLADAIEFLRGHLSGLLRFDGDVRPVKIIVDREGRLFAPVMVAMIRSLDTVMCVPDDGDEAMQMRSRSRRSPRTVRTPPSATGGRPTTAIRPTSAGPAWRSTPPAGTACSSTVTP